MSKHLLTTVETDGHSSSWYEVGATDSGEVWFNRKDSYAQSMSPETATQLAEALLPAAAKAERLKRAYEDHQSNLENTINSWHSRQEDILATSSPK